MVNTITKQTIVDGERNLIVKAQISGDGSGEETNTVLVDISEFAGSPTEVKIVRVKANLVGFSAQLLWDADTNVKAADIIGDREVDSDFSRWGGTINDSGSGKTGDILITTLGLGSGDEGTIVLEMKKRG